uniref:Uncharacterized protein n=1 Tax=Lactuca sativa TaxID=4236 RepID=A0A9R1XPN8_LACSA|nr:hypothetical protein LSAT_V11C300133670 [Lactuca sativa]
MLLLCEPHGPHETLVVISMHALKCYVIRIQMWIFGVGRSPMCQRSIIIIPGLLRTLNRYEVEVGQLKMYLLASWVFFLLFVLFWN